MIIRRWRRASAKKLPMSLRNKLIREKNLDCSLVDSLECLEQTGVYAGHRVKYVQVFDPAKVPADLQNRLKYQDLKNHGDAIWFTARVDQEGGIQLTDMRPGRSRYARVGHFSGASNRDLAKP